MAKLRIFTVGFELPGEEFEHTNFASDRTLLDADVILFEPTLGHYGSYEEYEGRPLLNETSSFQTKKHLDHWRTEITAAVNVGKLVIIYMAKPIECYRYTGEKQFSGTGRSRVTTRIVAQISSYEAVPNLKRVVPKSGIGVKIEPKATEIASYWAEFSSFSPYEAQIEDDTAKVLLRSHAGNRIVGAAIDAKEGHLLFLPPLRYDEKIFTRYDSKTSQTFWTNEAVQFAKRLAASLAAMRDALRQATQATPRPTWACESRYRLLREGELESAISTCIEDISKAEARKVSLEKELRTVGDLRRLLYEQGRPLEDAILEAMSLFGFEARRHSDGASEFDVVLVSPEGRCIGEAEGKDKKAINVEKFAQLERNIHEDFARDEVSEQAKGVLFGNAFRLLPPDERSEFFTEKCLSAARRVGAALIRTPDLFGPARYLKENPSDAAFAARCRQAIFRTTGDIVGFPVPPVADSPPLARMRTSGKR